jgi:single-strand DNA-binding protein
MRINIIFKKMNHFKNKVNLMGRLGGQPEIIAFDSGKKLARFSVATNDRYKDKNGDWQEEVQWHIINTWGKMAEKVERLLNKGQEILLEGKIAYQNYEAPDGTKRFSTVIELNDFMLLGRTSPELK